MNRPQDRPHPVGRDEPCMSGGIKPRTESSMLWNRKKSRRSKDACSEGKTRPGKPARKSSGDSCQNQACCSGKLQDHGRTHDERDPRAVRGMKRSEFGRSHPIHQRIMNHLDEPDESCHESNRGKMQEPDGANLHGEDSDPAPRARQRRECFRAGSVASARATRSEGTAAGLSFTPFFGRNHVRTSWSRPTPCMKL